MPAITINMDQRTVNALSIGGYHLYGFKGVMADKSGEPLVWIDITTFSLLTTVSWEEEYQAYTTVTTDPTVTVTVSAPIKKGQMLDIIDQNGAGKIETGPKPDFIAIHNSTTNDFTCGISVDRRVAADPIFRTTIGGGGTILIKPIPLVLLAFSTKRIPLGSVVIRAFSPGALIDLKDVSTRAVNFDINRVINHGWDFGGQTWGTTIDEGQDISNKLVLDKGSQPDP